MKSFSRIQDYFPFEAFREKQLDVLLDAKDAFNEGKEVVIIDGATGFGKSPVNIALAKYFSPSFYTTPQIKLVNQIAKDFSPKKLAIDGGKGDVISLLGRANYICKRTGEQSDRCPARDAPKHKCSEEPLCTYWKQKESAMDAKVAVITFAMLIINTYLPEEASFKNRNLLILDECHSLESQVASMFAGFSMSVYNFTSSLRDKIWGEIKKIVPKGDVINDSYISFLDAVQLICSKYKLQLICSKYKPLHDSKRDVEKIDNFVRKIDYMLEELNEDRIWVVNKDVIKYEGNNALRLSFKPIRIDTFLRRKIWSQADKFLLTSATIPFRDNPKRWLQRLGLGDKSFKFISVPMMFPLKNRPIYMKTMGGKMTSREEERSWPKNIQMVKAIIKRHGEDKGVIHTQSYKRAFKLSHDLRGYSVFLHDKEKINGDVIKAWMDSKKKVLLSPAVSEGVDLKNDLCRYQILLKVPYPSIGDKRVKYLLNVKKEWVWYFAQATMSILQMYGRAIRSKDDYAKFYIIDGSFADIIRKNGFPDWFRNAIIRRP